MYLCDDKHDEVCYESRNCPVCESTKEIDRLQREIEELQEELKEERNRE